MGKYDDILAGFQDSSTNVKGKYDDILASLSKKEIPDSLSNLWGSSPELRQALSSDHPIWNSLKVPSEMSARGLNAIASKFPEPEATGNMVVDLAKDIPHVAATTMAKAAPGFVSRGSLVTAGGAKALQLASPLIGSAATGIAKQLEQSTGAKPGAIQAALKDATVIRSRGKQGARPLYQAAKDEMAPAENIFKGMYKPEEIIDTAKEYLSKGGKLEPPEALMYRKALDKLIGRKGYVPDELIPMRMEADAMAKTSENIAKADPLYQKGMYGESLRNFLPQNKNGGASAFKMGIMAALEGMGFPGKVALMMMSPAVSGGAATVGGLAARTASPVITNPKAMVALKLLKDALYQENAK